MWDSSLAENIFFMMHNIKIYFIFLHMSTIVIHLYLKIQFFIYWQFLVCQMVQKQPKTNDMATPETQL